MNEKPILFSAPMVRAVLDGTKTQTRRVVKLYGQNHKDRAGGVRQNEDGDWLQYGAAGVWLPFPKCPCGKPGDHLWVREAFTIPRGGGCPYGQKGYYEDILFAADDGLERFPLGGNWTQHNRDFKWKPSIHMPRAESRILLRVTDLKVERVQDVSRDDAAAEGVDWKSCPTYQTAKQIAYNTGGMNACASTTIDYIGGFKTLWDSINAKRGFDWNSNPWVWAVTFERGVLMNQESLFNTTGPVPARASTAPESAQVLASKRGRIKALALQYLSQAPRGLSDEEITDRIRALGVYCRHTSTVSARNALCEMKLVEDSGLRRLSPTSGFRCTVWRCVR